MKHRVHTVLFLAIVLVAGCNAGNGGSGPEPGDTCSTLDERTCSGNGLYVLRCEEDTSGALHWFIYDECDEDNQEACLEGECFCSQSLCQDHCLEEGMNGQCSMWDCECTTCNDSACSDACPPQLGYRGECSSSGTYCACLCDPARCSSLCTATGGTTGTCLEGDICECDGCDDEMCRAYCTEHFPEEYYGWCGVFGCDCD
jgi:hypothetical protein